MSKPKLRFPEFKDLWNNYKIEDMFDRVGTPVDLDDAQTYREIGIRSHGKGIFHKEETTASEIGNKRVFWVEPNCFVVNIVFAWERAVAKTTEDENGMIASHRFPMYKPKKDVVDLVYITEYFITKRGQNVLILASPGGAGRNKTLGQKEFAKSVVKLPSLPEQQKIAEFLSTIDTVIEKQKETVSAWEERKKGVMQKLFSQEVRFKADDGSEFSDWEEKKLDDLVTEYNEKTTKNNQFEVLSSTHDGIKFQKDHFNKKTASADTTGYKIVPRGYFTYRAMSDNDVFVFNRQMIIDKGIVSPAYPVFYVIGVDKIFFEYYINNTDEIRKQLITSKEGGTRYALSFSKFCAMYVRIPSDEIEQQKIADCLSSLDGVIEKQKATLAAWEELKKGLLQQMFV